MIYQGMESAAEFGLKGGLPAQQKRTPSEDGPAAPDPAIRAELMKSIRQKIKSGYYNSEAVLDDLSHGFASALNSL